LIRLQRIPDVVAFRNLGSAALSAAALRRAWTRRSAPFAISSDEDNQWDFNAPAWISDSDGATQRKAPSRICAKRSKSTGEMPDLLEESATAARVSPRTQACSAAKPSRSAMPQLDRSQSKIRDSTLIGRHAPRPRAPPPPPSPSPPPPRTRGGAWR